MNKIYSIAVIAVIAVAATMGGIQYGEAFLHSNNNPTEVETPEIRAIGGISDDVWQESCSPIVILASGSSCQQLNVVIQQNAKLIALLENFSSVE